MRVLISAVIPVLALTASAQSLFILRGERAVDVSVGWSVGPVSDGIETHASVSLGGRWDVAVGFARYLADFGGDEGTRVTEWSPLARYFLFKEADDETPVSVSVQTQFVQSRVDGGADGWYVLTGAQLYKTAGVDRRDRGASVSRDVAGGWSRPGSAATCATGSGISRASSACTRWCRSGAAPGCGWRSKSRASGGKPSGRRVWAWSAVSERATAGAAADPDPGQ